MSAPVAAQAAPIAQAAPVGRATKGASLPPAPRLALLALAGASMLAAILGALALLGYPGVGPDGRFAAAHGVLMSLGFLGTLIALERAVALGRAWAYVAPAAAGLSGVALIAGAPAVVVTSLLLAAAVVYVGIYTRFVRMDRGLHTWVQAAGSLGWLGAALVLHAGRPVNDAVPALVVFLILTVAGERLELARLATLTGRARSLFMAAGEVLVAGAILALIVPDAGVRLTGLGLLALAAWLARFDIARRTVRLPGVTRYIALCLLAGYAWLAVGGATWMAFGATPSALQRDAMLHALFLGFVISMVFGHAPVILPAVLRVQLPWHPWFYGHLALLHAGLALRVAGDLAGAPAAWQLGGVLTVTAVLLFVGASVTSAVGAARASRRAAAVAARRRAARAGAAADAGASAATP